MNMDYEQRYNDALDRAKKLMETCDSTAVRGWCEHIFPELYELEYDKIRKEDERVRKELIDAVKGLWENNKLPMPLFASRADAWMAWLEKQGKTNIQNNKPFKIESDKFYFCIKDYFAGGCYRSRKGDIVLAQNGMNMMGLSPKEASEYFIPINPFKEHVVVDWFVKEREKPQGKSALEALQEETVDIAKKIKPKFKVGDWVVFNGLTLYINEVVKGYYRTISKDGIPNSYDWDIDNAARLWIIKEARDGNVLVCESGWTCIFKTLVNDETFGSYCFMDSTGWFCELGSECHTLKEEFVKAYNGKIQPAKKEQRDLFFKKMQESGYVWNAEKKVLKNLKPKFNVGDWIVSANGKVNQVISVDADNVDVDGYTLDDGVYFSGTWCNSYHLWTIKDAKEGDVLSYETDEGDLWVMLYWSLYEPYEGHVHYHALLVNDNFTDKGTCCICIDDLKPATIEQHELLFRKMKEEGYQWDKNKKELINCKL